MRAKDEMLADCDMAAQNYKDLDHLCTIHYARFRLWCDIPELLDALAAKDAEIEQLRDRWAERDATIEELTAEVAAKDRQVDIWAEVAAMTLPGQ